LKHAWFAPNPFDRVTQLMPQMREIEAADVAQLDPFELFPQALAWIEFGGVRRQARQVHPLGRAIGQERLDDLAAMDGGAIPNNEQAAGNLTEEVLQKGHDISRVHRMILRMAVELALGRKGADRRQVVTGIPFPQNRRLADGSVGAHDTGQRVEPGLVYEQDRLLLGLRPFLIAGQVSSRHCAMAASLRCRARRTGFCGLQRIRSSRRPT
jgi:hypothetical protein